MNHRWMGDYSFCNNQDCDRAKQCWRYQALVRLGEDQAKNIRVPYQVSVVQPDHKTCDLFIKDEYEPK